MSERSFDELSVDEQRNEILKAIHNRLSEIIALLPDITDEMVGYFDMRSAWDRMSRNAQYINVCSGLYEERQHRKEKVNNGGLEV